MIDHENFAYCVKHYRNWKGKTMFLKDVAPGRARGDEIADPFGQVPAAYARSCQEIAGAVALLLKVHHTGESVD